MSDELEFESAATSATKPELVPQPHGGALYRGGVPGNKGGRGYPASVRRRSLELGLKGLNQLSRRLDGEGEPLSDSDTIRATDIGLKHGLATLIHVVGDDSTLAAAIDLANELLPPDLAKSFIAELTARIKGETE